MMTAKEFLSQAYRLDKRIERKIVVVQSLNDLATKATATISGMPHNPSGNKSQMADTVMKIIDLQNEINADIDMLVDLKAEIISVIKRVENSEYQMLLEQRYLCYESWDEISADMNYGLRWTHIMHERALGAVAAILSEKNKVCT